MLQFKEMLIGAKTFIHKCHSLVAKDGITDAQGHLHGAAGTGHGGQFVARDVLAQTSQAMGRAEAKGTTVSAAVKHAHNRAKALVSAMHGNHAMNAIINEHKAIGRAAAHAAAHAEVQAATHPTPVAPSPTAPIPVTAPAQVAATPIPVQPVAEPVAPTTQGSGHMSPEEKAAKKEALLKGIRQEAFIFGAKHAHAQANSTVLAPSHAHKTLEACDKARTSGLVTENEITEARKQVDSGTKAFAAAHTRNPDAVESAPITDAPSIARQQLLHEVKERAFDHGALIGHSTITSSPTPKTTPELEKAKERARQSGLLENAIQTVNDEGRFKGLAGFNSLHSANPDVATALPKEAVPDAVRGHQHALANPVPIAQPVATPAPVAPPITASTAATSPTPTAFQAIASDRYTNTTSGHNKFWKVAVHGPHMVVQYGPIGHEGTLKVKTFPNKAAAKAAADALAAEKRHGGYVQQNQTWIRAVLPVLPTPSAPIEAPTPVPVAAPIVSPVAPTPPPVVAAPTPVSPASTPVALPFNPVTAPTMTPGMNAPAIDHLRAFIAAHVQRILARDANGLSVDPDVITLANSPIRRSRLRQAVQREGLSGTPGGSELNQARTQARIALAHQRATAQQETPSHTPSPAPSATPAATPTAGGPHFIPTLDNLYPATPAPAGSTPLEAAIHALREASHQRGRNIAQHEYDANNTSGYSVPSTYARLREKISNLAEKVVSLSTYAKASEIETEARSAGQVEREAEIHPEKKATKALKEHTYTLGYAKGYQGGFNKPPIDEATKALRATAATEAAKAHEELVGLIGKDKADSIREAEFNRGVENGKQEYEAEKKVATQELVNAITKVAHTQGKALGMGDSGLPLSTLAGHSTKIAKLAEMVGQEEAQKVHDDALAMGKAEAHSEIASGLEKASRVIGYHAGKNTEPTTADRLASEKAHALAKQQLGLAKANEIATKGHEQGKHEALNPNMTEDKVSKHLIELGLQRFDTPSFRKAWVNSMPKISPTAYMHAFFGEADTNEANLSKLDRMSFESYAGQTSSLYMDASHIRVHGGLAVRFTRHFDFNSKTVEHSYLEIAKSDQNKKSVRKMFKALFTKGEDGTCPYEKMGMKKAHVHGALASGGYTWPKYGFYYDSESAAKGHQKEIRFNYMHALSSTMDANDFNTFKSKCENDHVQLPNEDGTFSVRPYTEADHAKYKAERTIVSNHLNNNTNVNGGWILTNMNTPMMNAVHSQEIKSASPNDQRPSFVKLIMRGTSNMYGTIDFGNETQMKGVRDYIGA